MSRVEDTKNLRILLQCQSYLYISQQQIDCTRTALLNYAVHKLSITEKSPYYVATKFRNTITNAKHNKKVIEYLLNMESYDLTSF